MNGRTILGTWGCRSPGRVGAGAPDLCNPSGRHPEVMGLGRVRFMLRRGSLPRSVRSIARRTFRPSRCVGQLFQISALALRHEPGSQALREVSKRRPCVCSLHAEQHGGRVDQEVGKFCPEVGNVSRIHGNR